MQDDHELSDYWHRDWKQLEDLKHSLMFFQQIQEPPDWDVLLKDLQTLQPLRSGESHPLSDYRDFDLWPFFMHLVEENELFSAVHHVYFDESTPKGKTKAFLDECSILLDRLHHYEPLRAFWEHMPK